MAENKIWKWYRRHKEAVGLMLEFARGVVPGVGLVIGGLQMVLARMNDNEVERDEVKEREIERLLEEIKPIVNEVVEEIEENPDFTRICGLPEEEMLKHGQKILREDEEIREELEKIMPQLSQSLVVSVGKLEKKAATKTIGGRYELLEKVGRGGQGEVWKVKHILADKIVAIKFLPEELSGDENGIAAVRGEYGRVTNLIHPHIVQYREFDYDSESKRYFLVMDYVEGTTLRVELMRRQNEPIKFKEAWELLEPIGEALDFAHGQKIVHCDLKPENILVRKSDGKWLLTDFGLAKEIRHSLSLRSMKVDISGTMPYMSPEQYKGRRATVETDIWALGVMLYEMVAGYHPFYGTSFEHYMKLVCEEEVERPENLEEWEWGILAKMLAKEKQERPSGFKGAWQKGDVLEITGKPELVKSASNESAKLAEEMRKLQEQNRMLEEQIAREKDELERKKKEEEDKLRWEEELEKAKREQERLAAEKRQLEEQKKADEKRLAEEKRKKEEAKLEAMRKEQEKLAEEKRRIEQQRQGKYRGFQYLQEKTYSCNGQSYTVKEYRHEKTGMEFVAIPEGEFMMGSNEYDGEKPIHKVKLSGFLMAKTTVTQSVWQKIMGTTPWKGEINVKEGGNYPATYVSWNDAQKFCENSGLVLPTETQWEYACRSGSSDKYYWGDNINGDYAWYNDNAKAKGEKYAHEVGQKKANAYGLCDMSGNVWEWCKDWYGNYSELVSEKGGVITNPQGVTKGSYQVLRGGSWLNGPGRLRAAYRSWGGAGFANGNLGFRCVFEAF